MSPIPRICIYCSQDLRQGARGGRRHRERNRAIRRAEELFTASFLCSVRQIVGYAGHTLSYTPAAVGHRTSTGKANRGRSPAMTSDELWYLELVEVGRCIRARQLSSVEVTQAILDRIVRLDPHFKAYATLTPDLALAQARQADQEISRGALLGPLHGVPIAVKDLCHTKGIPTAAGMPMHKAHRPAGDATVVTRLRAAGAVLLGKLQLTEGAYGAHHPAIDPPVNPWSAVHWTGVSSSGSGVATAAGLCYGSLGSDTGGSIRFPSTMNGVTGLKPTWGRVSRAGVFALAPSMDHVGPIARNARDAAALLGALAGADVDDPTAAHDAVPDYLRDIDQGVRALRIGIDRALSAE